MDSILLDTNVLSELMHTNPEQAVIDWFGRHLDDIFYISAITQAEIRYGIAVLPAGKRRDMIAISAEVMFSQRFAGRCLPFDEKCTANYAAVRVNRRRAGQEVSTEDAMIAAVALSYGFAIATRNTKDFLYIEGLILHNPWQVLSVL